MTRHFYWLGGVILAFCTFAVPIITSTPFDTARSNGMSYVPALMAGARWFPTWFSQTVATSYILLLAASALSALATYKVMITLNRFNAGQKWWIGLQRLTIRRAACALADNLPEERFEDSPRAKALAEELLSLVNHGQMPLADEPFDIGSSIRMLREPQHGPYGKKDRTVNALISVRTLNSFARGRNLKLPWPLPPKKAQSEPKQASERDDATGST